MKIRWTQGSVRLRITPPELAALVRGEAVEETLCWGEKVSWHALLKPGLATQLTMQDATLTFTLSADDREHLADGKTEGVYFTAHDFRYFVEKDFPCVHPRAGEALEPPRETFLPPPGFEERKA